MKVKIWYEVFSKYVFCRIFNEKQFQSRMLIKVALLSILTIVMCTGFVSAQGQLAFPGAEGFGKFSKGGRGGKVIYVTNLNDSGGGSFREAVEASGPRVVVFKVGGTITLKSQVLIDDSNITIAGQTAPGDGILIKGGSIKIKTSEVIIRNIRFRLGSQISDDGITISSTGSELSNIILDHCSVSWASDENIGINGRNGGMKNLTIQNCIIAEGIKNHSMGLLVNKFVDGVGPDRISIHNNLFISNQERNPMVGSEITCTVINNLTHNWKTKCAQFSSYSSGDVLYNKFKPGNNTEATHRAIEVTEDNGSTSRVYIKGNDTPSGLDNYNGPGDDLASKPYFSNDSYGFKPIENMKDLESHVLANAGAFPRDAVDSRLVGEYESGTGKTIYNESEVGGYPTIKGGTAPKDTDNDGMPDEWEVANGLNPNIADDTGDKNGDGYSNIENYINCLINSDCGNSPPPVENTAPSITKISDQIIEQDASTEALAFTINDKESDASSLTVTATSNNQTLLENKGITLSGDGNNRTITLIPLAGASGIATIEVTVSDGTANSSTSFKLTVQEKEEANSAPKISEISDQIISIGESLSLIAFTVSDTESNPSDLIVTASSSNVKLVDEQGLQLSGSGSDRTIKITPNEALTGTATILVQVSDGENKSNTEFLVTVQEVSSKPVNSAPVVKNPGNQNLEKGSEVSLQVAANDPDEGDIITFSATGLPQFLKVNAESGLITGKAETTGSYSLIIRATDKAGLYDEEKFIMTISEGASVTESVFNINSGGGEVSFNDQKWLTDQFAKGGKTYSNAVAIAGTENDKIYQTERYGAYSYEIPLANGTYSINLHFAEIYFGVKKAGGVGSRVFNVNVENGQGTLQNYDIIESAGAAAKAIIESINEVKVTDGFLTIKLSAVKDNPKISAIEIISLEENTNGAPIVTNPGNQKLTEGESFYLAIEANDPDKGDVITYAATGLPSSLSLDPATGIIKGELETVGSYKINITATDPEGMKGTAEFSITVEKAPVVSESLFYINAGGGTVAYNGVTWQGDQFARGGTTYSNATAIAGTDNDKIYQTERYGDYTYEIPLPQGNYDVKLHFAEVFFGVKRAGGVGSRVFNVDIEGGQGSLTNYDIFKSAGGSAKAVVENVSNVNVSDGFLSIVLSSIKENAKISAIEIILSGSQESISEPVSSSISVYPNPFEDKFVLDLGMEETKNDIKVLIYNGLGREIYQEIIPAELTTSAYEINLSNVKMEPGNIYYLRTIEEGTAIKKFTRIIKK